MNEKVVHFADIGAALIQARDKGLNPFSTIEKVMPWDKVVASIEEAQKLARPIDYKRNPVFKIKRPVSPIE